MWMNCNWNWRNGGERVSLERASTRSRLALNVRVDVGVCEHRRGLSARSREHHHSESWHASRTIHGWIRPTPDSTIAAFFFRQHRSHLVSIPSVIRGPSLRPRVPPARNPPYGRVTVSFESAFISRFMRESRRTHAARVAASVK